MNPSSFRWYWTAACAAVMVFVMAPIVVVILGSFTPEHFLSIPTDSFSLRWYYALSDHPEFWDGFKQSLQLAFVASLVSTIVGVLGAIGVHRMDESSAALVSTAFLSPLMIPSLIIGFSILQFFTTIHVTSPYITMTLAHSVVTFPYVVRSTLATLSLMERRIEWAAANLGASPLRVLWHVTIPSIRPGIVGGLIIAFIVSFDTVTISIFLQTPAFKPLPVVLFNFVEFGVDPVIASLSTLLMIFSAIAILLADKSIGIRTIFGARA